ncbi:hypothetical protein HGH93_15575 [Chitinophaga polysaccharea]|uniref:hypothetical protein n=1 Tax=Chitinophaga TaxID=79328 RepID=UPI001455B498|nr:MULTISPECIES: hypothetical protein [Chitinophaga]NLR59533.1 hypothetical protein [Chitinophaga polysaccharea]NLU96168.1 hypothetical protein [Chitinophaga sp. Ak27]
MISKKGIIVATAIFSVLGIMLLTNGWREKNFQKNAHLTAGEVTGYYIGTRGSGVVLQYKYEVNGTSYYGGLLYYRIVAGDISFFLNHKYPLLYSSKDPGTSRLLIFPDSFEKNGISFPDSLNWVLKHIY